MADHLKGLLRCVAIGGMRAALRASSRPYVPAAASVLVVAPHPDDETLGCGGLIAARARAGRRTEVVFLTDGAGSHPGHPSLSPADLARRRRAEALEALGVLGVAPDRVQFWEMPDGGLDRLSAVDWTAALERMIGRVRQGRPDEIFAPFRDGGSTEHTAALRLVVAALAGAGGGRLLEYPIWAWWNPFRLASRLGHPSANLRLRLGELRQLKLRALACHRTQVEPAPPWPEPVLPRAIRRACSGTEEFFFASYIAARQGSGL